MKSSSYTNLAKILAREKKDQEYKFGVWDCSIFTEQVIEKKLARPLSNEERTQVRIDYDLTSQYGGTDKQAYDRALDANDQRLTGAPGFLVDKGLASYHSLQEITDKDLDKGVACQISWKNGGGHSGFVSEIISNSDGSVKAIKVITAHSLKNSETGRTGAYEATFSMDKIIKITLAVAK